MKKLMLVGILALVLNLIVTGLNSYPAETRAYPSTVNLSLDDSATGSTSVDMAALVRYIFDHFYNSATGGIWDWPEGNLYIQWADSAAWSVGLVRKYNPETHQNELKNMLTFLKNMKITGSPLFYDFMDGQGNRCQAWQPSPPCDDFGQVIEFQLYRSALVAIALLEGWQYFQDKDPAFAESLKSAALDLQNWIQDIDGGWISTYNQNLRHKTIRDNGTILLYLLEIREKGLSVDQSKIDQTVNWLLSMQSPGNGGFFTTKELEVVYPDQSADQNAITIWAIQEYDKVFGVDHSSQINNWQNNYLPLVLDTTMYGSPNEWSFKNSPTTPLIHDRYVYINALMVLAFDALGQKQDAQKILDWSFNRFLSQSGIYQNGFGVGYINGQANPAVNSETHPMMVFAAMGGSPKDSDPDSPLIPEVPPDKEVPHDKNFCINTIGIEEKSRCDVWIQ